MTRDEFRNWLDDPARRPLVMGVLNVTPDSFSDGGKFAAVESAVAHGKAMFAGGADLVDVGGESTRPGSARVTAEEQIKRIAPVVESLTRESAGLISIDTTRAAVAEAALDAGAFLINDISGGTDDPAILDLAGRRGVPIVLMHMQGQPATMQDAPSYGNVVSEVSAYLRKRIAAALESGVRRENILIDPGIGFGKTIEHNLALLRELTKLTSLGHALVVGTSRKGFVGRITGESEPGRRLFGTAASVAWCVANGAAMVRVHDVEPMSRVVAMIRAIQVGVDNR